MSAPDLPLGFHWLPLNPDVLKPFDLPRPKSRAEEATQLAIVTEAVLVGRANPEVFISYSRREAWYAGTRRYRGTAYTYTNVTRTVDGMAAAGLIEHDRAPPGRLGQQSTFRPTRALVAEVSAKPFPVAFRPVEAIVLRQDGLSVEYRDTEQTRALRRRLGHINEAVAGVGVGHPDLGTVADGDPIRLGATYGGPARRTMHRVFTGDFNHHGRFYGPWWQNIPKKERAKLTINGEPIFEADYPRLHVTLAHAEAGVALEGDPYDIPPWPVPLIKKTVNIILNAKDRKSAWQKLAQEIGGKGAFQTANAVLDAVDRRHAAISGAFYTGAGLRFMNLDSGIAEGVLLSLMRQGLIGLPVHDSYIVPEAHKGPLLEAMAAQLYRVVNRGLSYGEDKGIWPRLPHIRWLPHMVPPAPSGPPGGPPASAPSHVVVVLLPSCPQGDLFGAPASAVPAADVFGWTGGVPPLSVRRALDREIRRRGLLHEEAAAQMGLSRPQAANIRRGRFGASPAAAERVKGFLLSDAVTVKASS